MNTRRQSLRQKQKKPLRLRSNEQYCLDFGQKVEPARCKTCGMLYVVGEESDETEHARYHAEFDDGIRWSVKLERPLKYLDDRSRIINIKSSDPKIVLEAVDKIIKMSEHEMSAGDDILKLLKRDNSKFFIYVTPNNRIVAYIFVEIIEKAYVLIDYETSQLSSEEEPAGCGIQFLWVHPKYRRQGIGTWLVDIARCNLRRTSTISRSKVAVCDPTEAAVPFFNSFLRNQRPIKVYQQK